MAAVLLRERIKALWKGLSNNVKEEVREGAWHVTYARLRVHAAGFTWLRTL